jgi:hypothetical protein
VRRVSRESIVDIERPFVSAKVAIEVKIRIVPQFWTMGRIVL